jgi:hypothetical protein
MGLIFLDQSFAQPCLQIQRHLEIEALDRHKIYSFEDSAETGCDSEMS